MTIEKKLHDKHDDFTFPIVNFPFTTSNIPTSPENRVTFCNPYVNLEAYQSQAPVFTHNLCWGPCCSSFYSGMCCVVLCCFVCLRLMSWVPNIVTVSEVSIIDSSSVFSNVYFYNKVGHVLFHAGSKYFDASNIKTNIKGHL